MLSQAGRRSPSAMVSAAGTQPSPQASRLGHLGCSVIETQAFPLTCRPQTPAPALSVGHVYLNQEVDPLWVPSSCCQSLEPGRWASPEAGEPLPPAQEPCRDAPAPISCGNSSQLGTVWEELGGEPWVPAGQWWGGAGAMWLRRRGDRVQPRPLDGLCTVCREPGPECGGASPVGPLQPVAPRPPPRFHAARARLRNQWKQASWPLCSGAGGLRPPPAGREGRRGTGTPPPTAGLHGGALCPPCRSANRSCQPQIQVRTPRAQRLHRFLEIKWGECADTSSVRP